MRSMYYRRNCGSYICTVGLLGVLLTFYVWGLKQNKQTGISFNLKRPKFKRDIADIRLATNRPHAIKVSKARENIRGVLAHGNSLENGIKGGTNTQKEAVPSLDGYGTEFRSHDSKESARGRGVKVDQRNVSDTTAQSQDERPLNVYIVDEHHEVLQYWFTAGNKGIVPKSGNTLVHIDGHSDLAPPVNVPGYYPFFKWPSTKQVKYMMQSNDIFIQAAAMAGLINRVIWVWPDWDSRNHDDMPDYAMNTLSLGWLHVRKGDRKSRAFCMCHQNGTGVECDTSTDPGYGRRIVEDDEEMFVIPTEDCIIRHTVLVEEIHENRALALLGDPHWLDKHESIILDIDEDFFGCSYAIDPILKSNLSMARLGRLDTIIQSNFCPVNSSHEKESDHFLMQLISVIRKQRACTIDMKLKDTPECKTIKSIDPKTYFSKQLESLLVKQLIVMCAQINPQKLIGDLVYNFQKLRIQQLRAIQTTGFCANTSPKTFQVNRGERQFGVCYGANTPDNSAVLEHTPTKGEVSRRAALLKGMFRKLSSHKLDLVTVARSFRDGFTPRMHFEQIEKSILWALNTTMGRPVHLHYDKDLLGGKRGWPSKHKA